MKRLQAYKYELQPNGEQQRCMRRFAGSCRFVFNKALALQKANHEAGNKFIGYVAMAKHLTAWRNSSETGWLSDAPVHPLQHALKDLERAYRNFFAKRANFPRFKKKGMIDSFRYPDSKQFKIDAGNSRVFLPKLGWLRYRNSRDILGTPKNITVSSNGGKWFVSIQTEREEAEPIHPATSSVGVDVGIARFATLSDGTVFEPINSFKKQQARLARYQRAMSRKTKFSNNWKKAKAKVTKLHQKIGNIRRDYLHKTTTTISQNHAMVCIEDLQVRNMSKSAAGSTEAPGRNVKAKSGLNKSILDQGWFEFRRQLEYKQAWRGGLVVAVNPRNTSRTCPCCAHVSAENRQTQASFTCVECGFEENADLVGAINILAAGHAVLACGGTVLSDRPAKQEPAEATTQELALV
ncbi:cytosine methyltransferase [Pusillimonas sp. T2]|uniref:RNA-guided endonuclease InsQ/TnpB family protein n=1 Tax=Pusillimonas sp. T2 TaxID=1548123 RepID=UPI000B9D33B3|nr:RNA-guided endonuclease TnpB family protein [Pusillimonas sp. T2]OXR48150.1 cytosine methyltransferase [Pusillimonas sp. T2]